MHIEDSALWHIGMQLHKKIPKAGLLEWVENMNSYLAALRCGGDSVTSACACSGTGIFHKVMQLLLMMWRDEFETGCIEYDHLYVCDNATSRQQFLRAEFPNVKSIFKGIGDLANNSGKVAEVMFVIMGVRACTHSLRDWN